MLWIIALVLIILGVLDIGPKWEIKIKHKIPVSPVEIIDLVE